jgi:F-box/leucine-rich repeat protein 2/20
MKRARLLLELALEHLDVGRRRKEEGRREASDKWCPTMEPRMIIDMGELGTWSVATIETVQRMERTVLLRCTTAEAHLVVQLASGMLSARELPAVMFTCRTLRRPIPETVDCLDGFTFRTKDRTITLATQQFRHIRSIDLSCCCNLTDAAAFAVASHCTRLTNLNLSSCDRLTDAAMIDLASHCTELVSVNLSWCGEQLTDAAVIALATNCPRLTSVKLDGDNTSLQLTDAAVNALASKCPGLTSINLDCQFKMTNAAIMTLASQYTRLTSVDLIGIGGLGCLGSVDDYAAPVKALASSNPGLTYVAVQGGDAAVKALALNCNGLTEVNLENCNHTLSDAGVEALAANCPGLTRLFLPGNNGRITNASVAALASHCAGLTALHFGVGIGVVDTSLVSGFVSLTQLDASACRNLTDAAICSLALRCLRLKNLNLSQTKITDAAVESLASHCTELTTIGLMDNAIYDRSVLSVAIHCAGLTSIDLGGCFHITDAAVEALATHCVSLTEIDLAECPNLTEPAIIALASHCVELRRVGLVRFRGFRNVQSSLLWTDAVAIALASNCPNLSDLSLGYCKVTDAAVMMLASHCTALEALSICSDSVTDIAVITLALKCPNLSDLSIEGCRNVTSELQNVRFWGDSQKLRELICSQVCMRL